MEVASADILVIIGTSLNVYPAASLVNFTRKDARIFLIDPKQVKVPQDLNIETIQKGAGEGMAILTSMLK
jgi:NAD-dependent deacetylase